MTYIIRNINPLDVIPSKGIGISIPFDGPTGLNTTYTSKDAIRTNLLNFLLTGSRERILNPNFGSGLRNQIFEIISTGTMDDMKEMIYDYVHNNFPIVRIEELIITPEEHTITVYFKYSVLNTNITDDISLNFNNG
jgi:phage baseplate assembly protein W